MPFYFKNTHSFQTSLAFLNSFKRNEKDQKTRPVDVNAYCIYNSNIVFNCKKNNHFLTNKIKSIINLNIESTNYFNNNNVFKNGTFC